MSKTLLLLVLVALFAVIVLAQEQVQSADAQKAPAAKKEGKKWTEKKCLRYLKVRCEYFSTCKEAKQKCVQYTKKVKHCRRWQEKVTHVKKAVCDKWVMKRSSKDCNKKVKVCKKTKFVREKKTTAVCAQWEHIRECKRRENVCTQRKIVKRCYYKEHPFQVSGPKSCPSGQILKFSKEAENNLKRTCIAGNPEPTRQCYSFLDPHHVTFKRGYYWDLQRAGDFVLAETNEGAFAVAYRMKMMGSWSLPTGYAIRINGKDIIEKNFDESFKLNGRNFAVINGNKVEFKNGGWMQVNGGRVTFSSPNGCSAMIDDIPAFKGYNLYVNVPISLVAGVRGACNEEVLASAGLFGFQYKSKFMDTHFDVKKEHTERQLENAKARCEGAGVKGPAIAPCIKDYLATGKVDHDALVRAERQAQKDAKIAAKIGRN